MVVGAGVVLRSSFSRSFCPVLGRDPLPLLLIGTFDVLKLVANPYEVDLRRCLEEDNPSLSVNAPLSLSFSSSTRSRLPLSSFSRLPSKFAKNPLELVVDEFVPDRARVYVGVGAGVFERVPGIQRAWPCGGVVDVANPLPLGLVPNPEPDPEPDPDSCRA